MKFFNVKDRELKWHNKNYFYASTLVIIVVLIFSHYYLASFLSELARGASNTYPYYPVYNNWQIFVMSLSHGGAGHLFGNILSFVIVSAFMERHFGSVKYVLMFVLAIVIGNVAVFAFSGHRGWIGASGTNYFLYAIFFVTIIFGMKKLIKEEKIFAGVCSALIVILMCWNGGFENSSAFLRFGFFSDLIRNTGHWSAFLIGSCVGLFCQIIMLGNQSQSLQTTPPMEQTSS